MNQLLLHVCCLPCLYKTYEHYKLRFENITLYYNNWNIFPKTEYDKRLNFVAKFAKNNNIPIIINDYYYLDDSAENEKTELINMWTQVFQKTCNKCYYHRFNFLAVEAKRKNFTHIASTLFISPYQDNKLLNEAILMVANEHHIQFCNDDLRHLFKESLNIARKNHIYIQNYCGCKASMRKTAQEYFF